MQPIAEAKVRQARHPWRIVCIVLGAFVIIASALAFGVAVGIKYRTFRMLFELDQRTALITATKRELGLQRNHADDLQDLWITLSVAPGKRNGYYADVGSADGVTGSNTKLLDDLGWKGVCIDPFARNMQTRTCQVFRQPVFNVSGQKVSFRDAGWFSGIDSTLNSGRNVPQVQQAPLVDFITATLDELLEKAHAPNNIDFMSLDIEGAEFEALRGLSLDRYRVDAFCIEHNSEEPKRTNIRQLLEGKGYKRVRSWIRDDWYVRHDLAYKYQLEYTGQY